MRCYFYWTFTAVNAMATVWKCPKCARNCVKLRKLPNRRKLFPAIRSFQSAAIHIIGSFPCTQIEKRIIVATIDRYYKLKQNPTFGSITAHYVASAFLQNMSLQVESSGIVSIGHLNDICVKTIPKSLPANLNR